ncbi:hypothetical protein ACIBI3_21930 [Actinomadura luteofluorescens]|uniref:hypothetical protein n=1 Tax=Actinomadura luteofluorescens TaxID=46163 RepID=UPI00346A2E0D
MRKPIVLPAPPIPRRTATTMLAGTMLAGTLLTAAAPAASAASSVSAGNNQAAPGSALGSAQPQAKRTKHLLIRYAAKKTCKLYPNHKMKGSPWKIPAGKQLVWRYNIDRTWAIVSDYSRSKRKQYPWWGVTQRNCIGKSVKQTGYPAGKPIPGRILQARSAVTKSGWRTVIWKVPASKITRRNVAVRHNATLRDPANLVLGNVPAGSKVHRTSATRSKGYWVKVYVPNLHRYGFIEANKLR